MDQLERVKEWYDKNRIIYEAFAQKVAELLRDLIGEEQTPYHSITSRVKTKDSYIEKIARKEYENPIDNIMDFAGVRIIAYTTSEVKKICDVIKREFEIDYVNSGDKAKLLSSDKVGYLSIHYIVRLSSERTQLKEYSRYKDMVCEIQVRTLLQHAWAEIEHDRSYKFSGVLPDDIRRRFHLIAGVLEMMDSEFQRLSDEIDYHVEKVREDTKKGKLDIPLDTASLIEYIISKIPKVMIGKTTSKVDRQIIEELNSFGIHCLKELEPLFSKEFCSEYMRYAKNREASNYIGLLRDAMICYNAELYFEKAWDHSWNGYGLDELVFWQTFGVKEEFLNQYISLYL